MSNCEKQGGSCGCGGGGCGGGSSKWMWIVLALAVVGVLMAKSAWKNKAAGNAPAASVASAVVPAAVEQGKALPRLVDLGATKCIPCKLMAPILEDLKKTYAGKLDITFIDVWENPEEGKKYGVNMIPTQIFFGADGKELFRHEGFYGKEDILGKWKELGVEF
ncbi:MAG: thioredoxin family protein [Kiritimatiellia bacterium]